MCRLSQVQMMNIIAPEDNILLIITNYNLRACKNDLDVLICHDSFLQSNSVYSNHFDIAKNVKKEPIVRKKTLIENEHKMQN